TGRSIGLLDADLHGPTAARMLGVREASLVVREGEVEPKLAPSGVRVMSSDLLLEEGAPLAWREPGHDGFVWRGTLAAGMLREFLGDVAWGRLDLLLVDMPPGSERLDTLAELVPGLAGIVVVTIPSDASYRAVKRAAEAARSRRIPILGVVENMAGWRGKPAPRSWRGSRSTRPSRRASMPERRPQRPRRSLPRRRRSSRAWDPRLAWSRGREGPGPNVVGPQLAAPGGRHVPRPGILAGSHPSHSRDRSGRL